MREERFTEIPKEQKDHFPSWTKGRFDRESHRKTSDLEFGYAGVKQR